MDRFSRRVQSNFRIIVLLMYFGLSVGCFTHQSHAATPEGKRLAVEVLSSMNITAQFDQLIPVVTQQMAKVLMPLNPGNEAQVMAVMNEIITPEIRQRLPEMIDQFADLYARVFSIDELRQLSAFYTTTLGRKLIASMPELQKAGFLLGARWGESVAKDALDKHKEALRQRGIKL